MEAQTDKSLRQAFLEGMSFAAATVNVVTTRCADGRVGMTVSAMASVSADTEKPSLLVCINAASSGATAIMESGVFCVNVLRDDQAHLSDMFAGRFGARGEERFGSGAWIIGTTGAPILEDALVSFDCRLTNSVKVGTHHVFFGEVVGVRLASAGMPLIYANRAYGTPFRLPPAALTPPLPPGASRTVRLACLEAVAPFVVPALLDAVHAAMPATALELLEGDRDQVIEWLATQDAALALVYDYHLPPTLEAAPLADLDPYVVLPAAHPLAAGADVSLAALADEPLILLDTPECRDYLLTLFADAGVEPRIGLRTSSFEMVRSLAGHGAGYGVLVTRPANTTSYDGMELAVRPIAGQTRPLTIAIAHRRGAALQGAAAAFLDLARKTFDRIGE